ncbi:MAG TPA: DUF488 family protein [Bryobacteraceae bacterium]|nr:DUF488 family protein [Bryobacteraceae bacterium]
MIRLKRIYDPPEPADGERFLVERLWARGIRKEDAHLAGWLKEVAPSTVLREWYSHDVERWPEFCKRYRAELKDEAHRAAVAELRSHARRGDITLVYAARDEEHNSAVVLRQVLAGARSRPAPAKRAASAVRHKN